MLVQVLGPVRAWRAGRELDLGPPGRRAVLGFLALARGKALRRTELVDALWGNQPPPSATNVIQTHVKHLRRALDPDRHAYARSPNIPKIGDGYALRLPPDQVDLERFHDMVRDAEEAIRAGRQDQVAATLDEALRLWHGPPLADLPAFSGHPTVLVLTEARRYAVVAYANAMIETRCAADALPVVIEEAMAAPLDETVAAVLVRLYAADGQRAKAFDVYDRTRRLLVAELGVDPGGDLAAAHAMLLRETPRAADAAPDRAVPAELPADVAGFTGRTAELAALDQLLTETGASGDAPAPVVISALSGTAGVGKTALAIHWAHRVRSRFPDGQLYLDLRGYDPNHPVPVAEALARLLETLGLSGGDIPVAEEARAARFRTEIADRRMLVVLDNASSVEQVRNLLPGTPSCLVVVTSRDSLAGLVALHGARRVELEPLSPDEAITLLRKLIGTRVGADPRAAGELVEQCARLPLALRVAAELAASRAETPLAELAGELRDRQRRLRLLDAGGDVRATVRVVFSWSYRNLPNEAAALFRALGWHPGEDLDRRATAALGDLDLDETGRLLDVLVRAHLVVRNSHGRYGMHDLLRAYAVELSTAQDSDVDRASGLTRLFDHYLTTATAATEVLYPDQNLGSPVRDAVAKEPRAWLDAERRNLVAVCAEAVRHGLGAYAVRLANTLYHYLEGGHYADALAVHEYGLRAARELGDRSGEAHAMTSLGAVHRLLGRYELANDRLRQALAAHRLIGDRRGEARTLTNLGAVEDRLGQHESARRHLDEALAQYRELDNRHGIASVLNNLGGLGLRPGLYQQASTHLSEAAALFRGLGNRVGEAKALSNLGDAEMHSGRYQSAMEHLGQALTLFRDMEHRYGQAIALSNLGTVHTRLGQHDLAVTRLREALAMVQETGHRYGEASVLNGLGEALHAAGLPGAREQHAAALRIATDTGDRDEQVRANAGFARP
jgi:DNA-binding SARP family transcriptional activator/Flp pilus assembly protein TadD